MKKTLLAAFIGSAVLLTGCQDKEAQAKIEQLNQTVAQLTTELNTAKSAIVAIRTTPEVIFYRSETLPIPEGQEMLTENDVELNYSIFTLETNLDWLNTLLLKQLNDKATDAASLKQFYEKAYNDSKNELLKEPTMGDVLSQHIDFMGQREKLATFVTSSYVYSGGAHGLETKSYLNVDLTTQKVLTLDDLFSADGKRKLKEILWRTYVNMSEGQPYVSQQDLDLSPNFYFDLDGIHFKYNPYEIGAYAEGEKDILIYWGELLESGLLKSESVELYYSPPVNIGY